MASYFKARSGHNNTIFKSGGMTPASNTNPFKKPGYAINLLQKVKMACIVGTGVGLSATKDGDERPDDERLRRSVSGTASAEGPAVEKDDCCSDSDDDGVLENESTRWCDGECGAKPLIVKSTAIA